MGRGAAVQAPEGRVLAPFDGTITVFFDTRHALGLHSEDGIDLLIHGAGCLDKLAQSAGRCHLFPPLQAAGIVVLAALGHV